MHTFAHACMATGAWRTPCRWRPALRLRHRDRAIVLSWVHSSLAERSPAVEVHNQGGMNEGGGVHASTNALLLSEVAKDLAVTLQYAVEKLTSFELPPLDDAARAPAPPLGREGTRERACACTTAGYRRPGHGYTTRAVERLLREVSMPAWQLLDATVCHAAKQQAHRAHRAPDQRQAHDN